MTQEQEKLTGQSPPQKPKTTSQVEEDEDQDLLDMTDVVEAKKQELKQLNEVGLTSAQ